MSTLRVNPDLAFAAIVVKLTTAIGAESAVTLNELAEVAGMFRMVSGSMVIDRREIEHLMETRLSDFPWLVISTPHGYYRPRTADEIDRAWAGAHSRICALARRMHTWRKKAAVSGFRYDGKGRFSRSAPRDDLFEFPPVSPTATRKDHAHVN